MTQFYSRKIELVLTKRSVFFYTINRRLDGNKKRRKGKRVNKGVKLTNKGFRRMNRALYFQNLPGKK